MKFKYKIGDIVLVRLDSYENKIVYRQEMINYATCTYEDNGRKWLGIWPKKRKIVKYQFLNRTMKVDEKFIHKI